MIINSKNQPSEQAYLNSTSAQKRPFNNVNNN